MGRHAVRVAVAAAAAAAVVVVVGGRGGRGDDEEGIEEEEGRKLSGRNVPASWRTKPTRFPSSPLRMLANAATKKSVPL